MYTAPQNPYPLDAFHSVARAAAHEVREKVQAPDALIGMAVLSTMAVACQGLIDVRLPTGMVRPVSLNLLVVADSGERKTTVDNLVSSPVQQFDEETALQFEADLQTYCAEKDVWALVGDLIKQELKKAIRKNSQIEAIQKRKLEHASQEPPKPRYRRIIRHNATARAVIDALEGENESIAFMCDEGEIILRSDMMDHLGFLNKAWDGAKSIAYDRAKAEHIVARNPRVSIALMVQKQVLDDFLDRKGNSARGSGHFARYLVAHPASTQGSRFTPTTQWDFIHLPIFHENIQACLSDFQDAQKSMRDRTIVEFSEEAKQAWTSIANKIEINLGPFNYLYDVQDFASKTMEISGRLAAILQWFSGEKGRITLDTFNRAWRITEWHLHEFKRIFSKESQIPQNQVDAHTLLRYLEHHYWNRGQPFAPRNDVLRNGPIRPASRFNQALELICMKGQASISTDHKRKRYIQMPGFVHIAPIQKIF